jgi:hypothetical protein
MDRPLSSIRCTVDTFLDRDLNRSLLLFLVDPNHLDLPYHRHHYNRHLAQSSSDCGIFQHTPNIPT